MAWKTETLIVGGKEVKGIQVREGQPYSIVRLDTRRMSDEEKQAVRAYFAPGTQKEWSEWNNTYLRVQSTLLKYPEIRGQIQNETPGTKTDPVVRDPTETASQEYAYEGQINEKQLPYLRRWAAERGARVETMDGMSTEQGVVWKYRITSGKDLRAEQLQKRSYEEAIFGKPTPMQEKIGGYTPTDNLVIPLPSVSTVVKQEREAMIRTFAEETVKEQTVAAHVKTFLSTEGLDYIGRVAQGKDPTDIVIRKIESEHTYTLSHPGEPVESRIFRSIADTVQSPAFEATVAFAGAYGVAKIAATSVGGAILSSTAGKTALAGLGVYYVGSSGVDAYTSYVSGNIDRAIGRVITTGVSLGAGFAGAKLGARSPVEVKLSTSKVKGASVSTPETKTQPALSVGRFESSVKVSGKEIPVKGVILGAGRSTGKGKGTQLVKIFIPKQKAGGMTIQETTLIRFGKVAKTGKGSYTVRTSEGVIFDATTGKGLDVALAGTKRGTSYFIERGRISLDESTIRLYTGSGTETTGNVAAADVARATRLLAKGTPASKVGDVPRTSVKMSSIQDTRWVDVSIKPPSDAPLTKPLVKGWPGALPGKGGTLPATKALARTVFPSSISVKAVGSGSALGLSGVSVAAAAASAASAAAKVSKSLSRVLPVQVGGRATAGRQRDYTATMNKAATVQVPRELQRGSQSRSQETVSLLKMPSVTDVSISTALDRATSQVKLSRSATRTATETGTDFVPAIPVIPTPEPPTPTFGSITLPGGIKIPSGLAKKAKYKLKTVVNPIPKELDIKLPKIKV